MQTNDGGANKQYAQGSEGEPTAEFGCLQNVKVSVGVGVGVGVGGRACCERTVSSMQ